MAQAEKPARWARSSARCRPTLSSGVTTPPRASTRSSASITSRVEPLGQHDVPREQPRPRLRGNAQGVAEAAGRDEHRGLAAPLEQRVGGYGRAHLHGLDLRGRDRFPIAQPEDAADARDRGVLVVRGVLGKQFQRRQRAVGRARHDIRERAASVHPELPAIAGFLGQGRSSRPRVSGKTQAATITKP